MTAFGASEDAKSGRDKVFGKSANLINFQQSDHVRTNEEQMLEQTYLGGTRLSLETKINCSLTSLKT
jgi:hypothetical protein